jgi:hypothetical protein
VLHIEVVSKTLAAKTEPKMYLTMSTAPVKFSQFRVYEDHSGVVAMASVKGLTFSMQWIGGEVSVNLVSPSYGTNSRQLHIAARRCRNAFVSALRERTTQSYRDATKAFYAAV